MGQTARQPDAIERDIEAPALTAIECRLKLYDEYDRPIVHLIRDGAKANERTIIQQIKFVLRQAAGGAN